MFVFRHANGEYVGIDMSSGGYPYLDESIHRAKWFHSVAEAKEYQLVIKATDWTLLEVGIYLKRVE